jgi:nucleoid-associated protein YgaU
MSFAATSRYAALPTRSVPAAANAPGAAPIVYVTRRFLPSPSRFSLLQKHDVGAGDRLDKITAQYLGDPEQFWRVCDANGALRPADLVVVGRVLRITLPEGFPGPKDA